MIIRVNRSMVCRRNIASPFELTGRIEPYFRCLSQTLLFFSHIAYNSWRNLHCHSAFNVTGINLPYARFYSVQYRDAGSVTRVWSVDRWLEDVLKEIDHSDRPIILLGNSAGCHCTTLNITLKYLMISVIESGPIKTTNRLNALS